MVSQNGNSKFILEHYPIEHRDIKHYTLPNTIINENDTNITYNFTDLFNYPNQSRGIVQCDHFESEIRCTEMQIAYLLLNKSRNSKKFLIVDLPNDFRKSIQTLHVAFVIALTTQRKLYVRNSYLDLSAEVTRIPNELKSIRLEQFSSSTYDHCTNKRILTSRSYGIQLIDSWDISKLLLSPVIYDHIPHPIRTHGLYIMFLWLFKIESLSLPNDQITIGISLEFKPNITNLITSINQLTEGYKNWYIYLYHTNINVDFLKPISGHIKIIHKFEEAFTILPQCDKFVGSLGFYNSFWISSRRGRGGVWLDPKDSLIMETSYSQSGLSFLIKQINVYDLMCPRGYTAMQNYFAFHAI